MLVGLKSWIYSDFNTKMSKLSVGLASNEVVRLINLQPKAVLQRPLPDRYQGYAIPHEPDAHYALVYQYINELVVVYLGRSNTVIRLEFLKT
ncbi:MAG: hypothetical protein HYY24_00790 [Verrucomicrobia bacterium]|nr:hypothetical protein [Verrucomicrobiota bacterium]